MVQSEQSRKQVPYSVNLPPVNLRLVYIDYKPFRERHMFSESSYVYGSSFGQCGGHLTDFSALLLCTIINIQTVSETSPAEKENVDCVKVCLKKVI